MASTLLQIFLKAPEPGKVKTRLIPDLGIDKATDIHTQLVEYVVNIAKSSKVDAIQCWVAGDVNHPFVQSLAAQFAMFTQQGENLGDKMHHALCHGLTDFEKVAIVGGDAYSLTPEYIEHAFELLDSASVVLGPAEDGGYILVAASQSHGEMFNNVTWGTGSVLAEQIQQLDLVNLTHKLLEERWDIDDINDIEKHAPQLLS